MPNFGDCLSPVPVISADQFCNGFGGCGNPDGMQPTADNLNAVLRGFSLNGDNANLSLSVAAGNLQILNGADVVDTESLTSVLADLNLAVSGGNLELRNGTDVLDAIALASFGRIPGEVILWPIESGPIPAGWAIMDGTGGRPDWRDKAIWSAGPTFPIGTTGGSATHDHGAVTSSVVALTPPMIPDHIHHTVVSGFGQTFLGANNSLAQERTSGGDTQYFLEAGAGVPNFGETSGPRDSNTGADFNAAVGHSHTTDLPAISHIPPHVVAYYIIKLPY